MIMIASSLFFIGSTPAAADVGPQDSDDGSCTAGCEAPGVADFGSSPSAQALSVYGLHRFGPPAADGEFVRGQAPNWQLVDDTDPPRAEFDDEAITAIELHDIEGRTSLRQRRGDDARVPLRDRIVDTPRVSTPHTVSHPAATTEEEADHGVLRLHGDEAPPSITPASVGDDETVIRIDGDEASINGNPVDNDEMADNDGDDQFFPDIDDDVDDNDEEFDVDDIEIRTGYMDWEFIPVVEVQEASGGVTPVDAQRMLERDLDTIADCFSPDGYAADGAVDVEVHLAHSGRPHAVSGSTDGVRPGQARCILQRAWGYEFARPAEMADEPSHVHYRVEFIGQTVDAPSVDPDEAQFLLERLSLDEHPELQQAAARSLTRHLDDAESCAVQSLEALPDDFIVTEVDAQWRRSEGHHFRPTDLDITVSNESSSELPPPRVVDCYRRALQGWDFDVEDADVAIEELPDEISGSFFVTLRPAGW